MDDTRRPHTPDESEGERLRVLRRQSKRCPHAPDDSGRHLWSIDRIECLWCFQVRPAPPPPPEAE